MTASPIIQKTVLVIDDYAHIRELLKLILEPMDFQVTTAHNGMEAIQLLEESDFDLLFSDIRMPQMGGFEFIGWLRENKPGMIGRTVLISGTNTEEINSFCVEHGCKLITKPFFEQEVVKVMYEIMDVEHNPN